MLQTQYKTYPGRFYVLVVTTLITMQQNVAWLTFGPIPEQAKLVYGLTDVEMTLFQGNIDWLRVVRPAVAEAETRWDTSLKTSALASKHWLTSSWFLIPI